MYIIYQDRGGLIALLHTWIFCALNSINVGLHAFLHLLAYLGEVAQELRLEALGHSQCISINQHLTVAAVTRSNTDSYGFYLTCYFSRQLSRNLFQNDGKNT